MNSSSTTATLFWIDLDGKRQQYNTLAPGQSVQQPTFVSHSWLVGNALGTCRAIYQAVAGGGSVVIR